MTHLVSYSTSLSATVFSDILIYSILIAVNDHCWLVFWARSCFCWHVVCLLVTVSVRLSLCVCLSVCLWIHYLALIALCRRVRSKTWSERSVRVHSSPSSSPSSCSDPGPVDDISHGVFYTVVFKPSLSQTLSLHTHLFRLRPISWDLATRCLAVTGVVVLLIRPAQLTFGRTVI